MQSDNNPNLALRLQVESGGCYGFESHIEPVTLPEKAEWPEALADDDVVFLFEPDDAAASDGSAAAGSQSLEGPKIVVDVKSLELLDGSKVTYIEELMEEEFRIIDNPNAAGNCGCGHSFDVDIGKKG